MATAPAYTPDAQADFDTWLVNFIALITAEPFRYGLLPAAAAIAAVTAEWTAAFAP